MVDETQVQRAMGALPPEKIDALIARVSRSGLVASEAAQEDAQYVWSGKALSDIVDMRPVCSAIEDQLQFGTCHDDQTEVLTDVGFRLFADVDGSERLATVDPKTSRLYFEAPTRLVRFPYVGAMHCVANQSLNFKVTPDHQLLVRKWDERARALRDEYEFVPAKDIGWYAGLMNRVEWGGESNSQSYTLPGVADHKHISQRAARNVSMRAWLRFLGIYLAEGTMLKRDQCAGRISYKVQIAASKQREKTFVRATLAELGLHALELADRFTFNNRQVYETMASFGLEGVKAGEKFVPAFVFQQSAEMIREFLDGHFAGDGCSTAGVRSHCTGSARLAGDLQTLIFLSGNETRVFVREARTSTMVANGRTIVGRLPEHRVSVCERKNLSIDRKDHWFTEHYAGEVFCAEVPTHHTLVTRRAGRILISGNCTGNTTVGAAELFLNRAGVFTPGRDELSRDFNYWWAGILDGTSGQDSGRTVRNALRAAGMYGLCLESTFPYTAADIVTPPSPRANAEGLLRRMGKFARIPHDPADWATSIPVVKQALNDGFPVSMAIQARRWLFDIHGPLDTHAAQSIGFAADDPKMQVVGGHDVLVVGYKDTPSGGWLLVRNSWSEQWGDGGYWAMPYECAADVMEFWAIEEFDGLGAMPVDPPLPDTEVAAARARLMAKGLARKDGTGAVVFGPSGMEVYAVLCLQLLQREGKTLSQIAQVGGVHTEAITTLLAQPTVAALMSAWGEALK